MKRKIKFRGKRYGDGDWVYGNLYQGTADGKQYSIILNDAGYHIAPQDDRNLAIAFAENDVNVVFTQTVGQFTGLLDKNGEEIYEGDICSTFANINKISDPMLSKAEPKYRLTTIVYDDAAFKITFDGKPDAVLNNYCGAMVENMEVVGNIYDNPELLKIETL